MSGIASARDMQWTAAIAYARGAGAGHYERAHRWATAALLNPAPVDWAECCRRIDMEAESTRGPSSAEIMNEIDPLGQG